MVTVDHADIGDIIKASRSVNLIKQIVHVPDLRIDPGTGNSRLNLAYEVAKLLGLRLPDGMSARSVDVGRSAT